jgi:hypothetical protein
VQPPIRTLIKLLLIGVVGAALGLIAQVPRIAAGSQVGTAILGFIGGPGPLELRTILGVFGAARIGQPIALPGTVTRLHLSARQHYALVEQNADSPLAMWRLDETVLLDRQANSDGLVAIAGALPHPDLVAFSPRGDSAALYDAASGQFQIIAGMPNKTFVKKTPPLESPATITMVALSDDASVVVTKDSAGDLQISKDDSSWRPLYGAYSPLAWSFIPKTHDLIISDSKENAVFLIEQADSRSAPIVLAENCLPNQLAATSAGETLAGLDSRRSILWTIDLKSRISSVTKSAQNLDSLITLRNGNTFLASAGTANPTLLRVSDNAVVLATALAGR